MIEERGREGTGGRRGNWPILSHPSEPPVDYYAKENGERVEVGMGLYIGVCLVCTSSAWDGLHRLSCTIEDTYRISYVFYALQCSFSSLMYNFWIKSILTVICMI